jgi:putative SOS response-associated peptidase YedK
MCGRFTLTTDDYETVARALEAELPVEHSSLYRPRYNVSPTDEHWVLCNQESTRLLLPAVWGLPSQVRGKVDAHINARGETAASKGPFRDAFVHTRCGVAADGFFEWTGPRQRRQPIWFHTPDTKIFVFAGLYSDHVDPRTGSPRRFFTILTTAANGTVSPFHHRMPVILDPGDIDLWLRPSPSEPRDLDELTASLQNLVRPAPDSMLVATPVSRRVNSPRNDDPACLQEVLVSQQGSFDF